MPDRHAGGIAASIGIKAFTQGGGALAPSNGGVPRLGFNVAAF
jgi:hypothetical protein